MIRMKSKATKEVWTREMERRREVIERNREEEDKNRNNKIK